MKNIDIDNINKRNLYKVPKGFYQEVQANVFNRISEPKENKTLFFTAKNYWLAASLIIFIFGVSIFLYYTSASHNSNMEESPSIAAKTVDSSKENPDSYNSSGVSYKKQLLDDSSSSKGVNQKFVSQNIKPSVSAKNQAALYKKGQLDYNFEKAVNNLNTQQLDEQVTQYELDTYLDLY